MVITRHMAIRPGDTVQYIRPVGQDFVPDPDGWNRHDPDGEPMVGDYGVVVTVHDDLVTVSWRFGATSQMSVEFLAKHPDRQKAHRFAVMFEGMFQREDVVYYLWTEGGPSKAVWLATSALVRDHPNLRPWSVEVEDLGAECAHEPDDLLCWDEVS
jgi:hypothetical protein